MSIVIKDAENGSGYFSGPLVIRSREHFLSKYPGKLPYPLNEEEPEKYPVLVYETTTQENWSGREYIHFVFFYDFEENDD